MRSPNFLLIITDQHRRDHLGCYGHPVLKTPNIDALATAGVRFDRFYVTTPVCMPNRAALMTGRMPSVNGVRHNGIPLSRNATTFVELLRAAGYRTALIGKSHLQTQTGRPPRTRDEPVAASHRAPPPEFAEARKNLYADGAYDQELPAHWQQPDAKVDTPFYGFDHVELHKMNGTKPSGTYRQWLLERCNDPDRLFGPENQLPGNTCTVPQAWRTAVPVELYASTFVADRAEAWLASIAGGDRPFFLQASFLEPHHPFTPPGRYWDMYRPEDMPVPRAFETNTWTPPPHVRALLDAHRRGEPITDHIMAHGIGRKEALEARALTCGAIALIDDCVGRIVRALERHGLSENTVVIFTSDHGEHLGDHRLLLKGLAHYDELLRVPFIWSEGGRTGKTTQALSQTIDLPATILDRAGLQPFNGLQGRSFLHCLDDAAAPHRSDVLVEDENQRHVEGLGNNPRERTLVTDRWRLSVFEGHDWGELYDLAADPDEFVNLWDDEACSAIRCELQSRLAKAMLRACDRSPAPLHQA
ncbi:MAG: sulfatase [Hyphomicrobiaceae bacterium]